MGRVWMQVAPSSLRASVSCRQGRRRICSSPVMTAQPSVSSVHKPITKLVVVPEFRVSMTLSGTLGRPLRPKTVQVLAFSSTVT